MPHRLKRGVVIDQTQGNSTAQQDLHRADQPITSFQAHIHPLIMQHSLLNVGSTNNFISTILSDELFIIAAISGDDYTF
jgi:hypothetical protein